MERERWTHTGGDQAAVYNVEFAIAMLKAEICIVDFAYDIGGLPWIAGEMAR